MVRGPGPGGPKTLGSRANLWGAHISSFIPLDLNDPNRLETFRKTLTMVSAEWYMAIPVAVRDEHGRMRRLTSVLESAQFRLQPRCKGAFLLARRISLRGEGRR